jgi:hypothetical protein
LINIYAKLAINHIQVIVHYGITIRIYIKIIYLIFLKVLVTSHNTKIYNCRYCNKIYNNNKSRWGHEQKCQVIFEEKEKQINEIKIAEINSNKEIKLAQIELEKINANKEIKLAEINKEIELKKLEIIASSEAYIRPLGL